MTTTDAHGTALVTGGGTGIGRACSLALAGRGHAVAVAVAYSLSADDAESAVGEIFDRLLQINTKAAWLRPSSRVSWRPAGSPGRPWRSTVARPCRWARRSPEPTNGTFLQEA